MQSRFGSDSQSVAKIVIAVHAVEKQGETLDDEVAVVRDSCTHVPRMRLVENVALNAEGDIHRLENNVHTAVFTQRNGSRKAVGQAQLEVEMAVAPSQIQQGIELLQVVFGENAVEIAVLQIQSATLRLEQVDLILQVYGMAVKGRGLITQPDVEVVGKLVAAFQGKRCRATRSAGVVILAIGLQSPLCPRDKCEEQQAKSDCKFLHKSNN